LVTRFIPTPESIADKRMGKKKGTETSSAPATAFQFSGGFSLGTGAAGDDKAVKVTSSSTATEVVKKARKDEEENDDDEDEEDDDEDDGDFNLKDLIDLSSLPKDVQKRVAALRKIQDDYTAIDEEYKKARIELERSFLQRKSALYEARRAISTGEVEVPDRPPVEGEEEAQAESAEPEEPVKGIPQFWAQVLNAHPQIGGYIVEEDLPALETLTNITCTYDEEFKSFTLHFHFAENEFFTNTVLTKTYHVTPDLLDDKAPSLKSTEGCEIAWKEGKNLCVEETVKKQRAKSGRNKGQIRTIKVTKPKQSFFHFFSPQNPEDVEDEEDDEKEGKEDEDDVKIHPEDDYDIGHAIRTSVIPEAVLWYTGEAALQYDYMFGGDEDDEDDDEDAEGDEGDDEEEDEEEEEEEEKPPAKSKGKKSSNAGAAAAAGADGEKPAECKQN
jgi:nucleosome assembly protein 1-like 1